MRRVRMCLYGTLSEHATDDRFIVMLAERLFVVVESRGLPAAFVTGGYLGEPGRRIGDSMELLALEGARKAADHLGVEIGTLYEAWVPDPDLDKPAVEWMTEKLGVTLRVVAQRTSLGRRLAVVRDTEGVITVGGRNYVETVLEQAVELGLPALRSHRLVGESRNLYQKHAELLDSAFKPGTAQVSIDRLDRRGLTDGASISSIVNLVA